MSNINKQALLIENGQLVADMLRHLANNEIDSDYFAIVSESENGTEIEHELAITDYALQAAGTVDELVKALECSQELVELQRFKLERQAEDLHQAKSLESIHRDKRFEVEREFSSYKDNAERNTSRLAQEVCRLEDELEVAEKRNTELSHHLQCAHAFIEHTEAFGHAASNGILCCGDAQWNIDESKSSLAAAGKGAQS